MKTFKTFISEMKRPKWEVPKEPGSEPIPKDHVRLYHQTGMKNLSPIRKKGIESRQPVEGPRGIYADEKGFYGKPHETPSVEFSVHKKEWDKPFVARDKVEPDKIIATHKKWHSHVRYIDSHPDVRKDVENDKDGEYSSIVKDKTWKGDPQQKAIRFVMKRAKAQKK